MPLRSLIMGLQVYFWTSFCQKTRRSNPGSSTGPRTVAIIRKSWLPEPAIAGPVGALQFVAFHSSSIA